MRIFWAIAIAVLPLVTFGQVPFSLQDRAFLQTTSPLRKDLVGYWRLEEASGTRYDYSKNGNHLTANNSPGQAAGVSAYTGNAATFVSTSSQSLSIPSNASLAMGDIDFAIAAWVYLTAKPAAQMHYVSKYNVTGNDRGYALYWNNSTDRFNFAVSSNGIAFTAVAANTLGAPSLSTWYHIVAWHDSVGDTLNIKIDNGTTDSVAYTTGVFSNASDFCIGRSGAGTQFVHGRADEVGIWKRLLTASEVTKLYNAGLGTHFPWAHP